MAEPVKGKILIVDDHEENREFLSRRLVKRGFDVIEAAEGMEALQLCDTEAVDLVLLDIMMPGIDGREVLRSLRKKYAALDLPIIMLTAKSDSADVVNALQLGANDYVTKPIDFGILLARVESHLNIRNYAREMDHTARGSDDIYRLEELYQSLFPIAMPTIDHFTLSYARVPAWKLGGDTLNIFMLDDLHVGVYLLDVDGHSAEAALFTSTLTHLLSPEKTQNSIFWEQHNGKHPLAVPRNPADAIAKLQQELPIEPGHGLRFALHYGILNLSDDSYTYVSVGQPTPVLLNPDGSTRMLPTDLGLLGDHSGEVLFHEHRMGKFIVGDQLYIFSGGIECLRDQEGLTEKPDKLVMLLTEGEESSIKDRLSELVFQVGEKVMGPREDDITVIGIQRNPAS